MQPAYVSCVVSAHSMQPRMLGVVSTSRGAFPLLPASRTLHGIPRLCSVRAVRDNQEDPSGGWNSRELLLLSEMVATRQQVDKLIELQSLLINMVAATHPAMTQMPMSLPGRVPQPNTLLPGNSAHTAARAPMADAPDHIDTDTVGQSGSMTIDQTRSPVVQLLDSMGASVPSQTDISSTLADALKLVTEGDVLKDLPLSTPQPSRRTGTPTPAPASAKAASPRATTPTQTRTAALPVLVPGMVSQWWMEKLHVALLARGYYCGDDDIQSWTFGEGTRDALSKFQHDQQLPHSGVSDAATWAALLADLPELGNDVYAAISSGTAPPHPQNPATAAAQQSKPAAAPPAPARPATPTPAPPAKPAPTSRPSTPAPQTSSPISDQTVRSRAYFSTEVDNTPTFNPSFFPFEGEEEAPGVVDPLEAYYSSSGAGGSSADSDRAGGSVPPKVAVNSKPPVMVSGDVGGFFMETLHTALMRAGCNPSFREVDTQEFGKTTLRAVKSFQDTKELPVTGQVDDTTWAYLLKDEPDLRGAFIQAVALGTSGPLVLSNKPAKSNPQPDTAAATNGTGHKGLNGSSQSQTATPSVTVGAAAPALPAVAEASSEQTKGLPELKRGADDIVWVSRLHRALVDQGFYPSDEECEDWVFGEGTEEAVLAAQAGVGLPETGVVCVRTWQSLLRDAGSSVRAEIVADVGPYDTWGGGQQGQSEKSQSTTPVSVSSGNSEAWPVVREGDGDLAVGVMQRCLAVQGYHCGDDEPQWWQFGPDTANALKTFQVCMSLPETGVCDAVTWLALKRAVRMEAESVEDLRRYFEETTSGSDDPFVDITAEKEGRVWLLGEQRWEQRAAT